jgi:hypothetical protein
MEPADGIRPQNQTGKAMSKDTRISMNYSKSQAELTADNLCVNDAFWFTECEQWLRWERLRFGRQQSLAKKWQSSQYFLINTHVLPKGLAMKSSAHTVMTATSSNNFERNTRCSPILVGSSDA